MIKEKAVRSFWKVDLSIPAENSHSQVFPKRYTVLGGLDATDTGESLDRIISVLPPQNCPNVKPANVSNKTSIGVKKIYDSLLKKSKKRKIYADCFLAGKQAERLINPVILFYFFIPIARQKLSF